jgi:parallel beta-helix repeat protein
MLVALPAFGAVAAGGSPGTEVALRANGGSVTIRRPGARTTLALAGQAARDVSVQLRVSMDRQPAGPGPAVNVIVRRSASGEYRGRMEFAANGQVLLSINRFRGGRRENLGGSVPVALDWKPGHDVVLKVAARGANPTRISITVWLATDNAPAGPQLVAASVAPSLAGKGTSAVRFALPSQATNAPVQFDFSGVDVSGQPDPTPTDPAATPTPTEPTPTPSPSLAPTQPPIPLSAYYVAPTGHDNGPGTADQPWRTPQKAANTVPAGATVVLRAGSYPPFKMTRSGSTGAPIQFSAYPGETAIVDGHDAVEYTVWLSGVHDVHITGLVVQGGYHDRQDGGGVMVENSTRVQISANLVHNNRAFGVRSVGSTYVTIADNEVTDNAVGVSIGGAGEGTVVVGNRIHDNTKMMINTPDIHGDDVGAGGVALVHTVGHVLVTDNQVWGNRAPSYDYGYDGSAFEIYGAQNWEFTDNIAWDNTVVFESGTDSQRTPCSNGRFTHNVGYDGGSVFYSRGMVLRCAEDAIVANNTFVGIEQFVFTLQDSVGTYGGSIEGLRIFNNVVEVADARVYSIDSAIPASVRLDADLVHITGSGWLAQMAGMGSTRSLTTFQSWRGDAADCVVGDPMFVDAAAHDYELRNGSPAIDTGLLVSGVTDDFQGSGPDRGAFESDH